MLRGVGRSDTGDGRACHELGRRSGKRRRPGGSAHVLLLDLGRPATRPPGVEAIRRGFTRSSRRRCRCRKCPIRLRATRSPS